MKLVCAKAILFLMTTSAAAITTNQQAFTYFTDAGGNVGFVYVDRQTDPVTQIVTTTLSYSYCVQTTAASCQEGNGVIPNTDFTGTLNGNVKKAELATVLADTSVPGFSNTLCNGPDQFGGCAGGISPATGGLVSLGYVTATGQVEVFTFNDYKLEAFKVTLNSTDQTSQGPASVQGTVLGTSVSNKNGASWGIEALSGKGSPGSQVAKAKSHLSLESSLPAPALKRLQRLRGEQSAE